MLLGLKIALGNFLNFVTKESKSLLEHSTALWLELFNKTLDVASNASRLAWNISVAQIVDIAVACFIDLAMASNSLESACTDIVCCCIHSIGMQQKKIGTRAN